MGLHQDHLHQLLLEIHVGLEGRLPLGAPVLLGGLSHQVDLQDQPVRSLPESLEVQLLLGALFLQ